MTLQVHLATSTILQTERSKHLENLKKKTTMGPMLGQDRLKNNSRGMFGSKRRGSESSTDIDRQNQRLRHEFRTECAR